MLCSTGVLHRGLALCLLLVMTPWASELVEWSVHWVQHGDFAHAEDAEHQSAQHDEHGCTPLLHACGCHSAAPSTPATRASAVPPVRPPAELDAIAILERAGRESEQPPHRPPIA